MNNFTYEFRVGSYLETLGEFERIGGRLFPQRSPDSPSTIVSGNRCITYWDEKSRLLPKCKTLCRELGFDWNGQTPGRIARQVLSEVVGLEKQEHGWGKLYHKMAKDGGHWHYTHVETGYHPYLIEFDLKSAYFTSLFQGRSILYHDYKGFVEDDGMLDNLRAIETLLPKFMRLIILGILASHKMQFYVKDKSSQDCFLMVLKTLPKIEYGMAFNAAHKAVRRTFELMRKIHRIGGTHIKRIHTDSFALSFDTPQEIESEIFNLLERNHYPVSVKAQGSAHFLSLNEGLIGTKLIGAKDLVFKEFREKQIRIDKHELNYDEFKRWELRQEKVKTELELIEREREKLKEYTQLHLFQTLKVS